MPFFSVVIPLYNKCDYIAEAVKSILSQDYGDFEIIVINDGSTDKSVEQVSRVLDKRVKLYNQKNSGVSVARNNGIELSVGEYICFLDADDYWACNHLSSLKGMIDCFSGAEAWATGYTQIFESKSIFKSTEHIKQSYGSTVPYDFRSFLGAWADYPFFWTGSIAVKKSTLDKLQPCFPVGEKLGEDQDLWFRLAEKGPIIFRCIADTAFYRQDVLNSLTASSVLRPLPAFDRLALKAQNFNPLTRKAAIDLRNLHILHIAWNNCVAGKRTAALSYLLEAGIRSHNLYWLRILFFCLLPSFAVKSLLKFLK